MTPKQQDALKRFESNMIRARLSRNTREQYLAWAVRFAKSSAAVGETPEERVASFISTLSKHSVATQKQALNALAGKGGLFAMLGRPLGKMPSWVNAKRPERIPSWVTIKEAEAVMEHLTEPWSSMIMLLIGSGLRIHECLSLRWRDLDFERLTVSIRGGKGDKDRVTVLSERMLEPLRLRYNRCRALYLEDRAAAREGVEIPEAIAKKYPNAGIDWPYFWVFPAAGESTDPASGIIRRHHVHVKSFARPLKLAVRRAGIAKRVTAHSFRHGFATEYLLAGGNIRELQRLMGHTSLETTEIYLHCLPTHTDRIGSPLDRGREPMRSAHIIRFPKSA